MKFISSKKFFNMSVEEIKKLMWLNYRQSTLFIVEPVHDQYEKERLWKIIKNDRNFKITIISLVFIVLTFLGTVLMIFMMRG